jgi:predicted nucleic acid-binding protein
LAQEGQLQIVATQLVLEEAEENTRENLGEEALQRFYQFVNDVEFELVEPTSDEENARWQDLLVSDDWHVLAGAHKGRADVLVTLDRRHILTERVIAHYPIPVQDTHAFFREWYQALEGSDRSS